MTPGAEIKEFERKIEGREKGHRASVMVDKTHPILVRWRDKTDVTEGVTEDRALFGQRGMEGRKCKEKDETQKDGGRE